MPFIWFILGSVVGGYVATRMSTVATIGAFGAVLNKLGDLPEPCRTQVSDIIGTLTEEDWINAMAEFEHTNPEELAKWKTKHPLPPTTLQQFMDRYSGHPADYSAHVSVSEQQLIDELHISPEQIADLRSRHPGPTPGTWSITERQLFDELYLSPEQIAQLHDHLAAPQLPHEWHALPAGPAAATGAHHAWGNAAWAGPVDGWGPDPYRTGQAQGPSYQEFWQARMQGDPWWYQREQQWRLYRHWEPSWGPTPPPPTPQPIPIGSGFL